MQKYMQKYVQIWTVLAKNMQKYAIKICKNNQKYMQIYAKT